MTRPMRSTPGTRLHVLDDGAVLFDEHGQDLYLLNATAAFVWCCLEDGLERDQVLTAIEQEYGVARAAAGRQVDLLLRQWKELELLADSERNRSPSKPPAPHLEATEPVPWSTDALHLFHTDALHLFHKEHCYRLLTTVFRLRYASAVQEAAVHPVLAHLETSTSAAGPATTVDLARDGEQHLPLLNGTGSERSASLDELAPLVKGTLLLEAINNFSYLLYIHAGVVRAASGCLLLPAASGSGKSSLTAALIRAGFTYFSDEVALLEEGTLYVRPVPVSLCLKDGAWDLLAPRYPEIRDLAIHHRWDGKIVRYLNPPPAALDPAPEKGHPVHWIVFPRYSPDACTELQPVAKAHALHRLLQQCVAMPAPLDQAKVASLVRWISEIPCYELPMSSLDEAVSLVNGLCRRAA
jgi:hypothetical protein